MFRKLTVIMCLISFIPAAVSAQGLTTAAPQMPAIGSATEKSTQLPVQDVNLALPAERSEAVLVAAAETSQGTAMGSAPARKSESRSSHSWDNFVDVHFGDYRWVWWAAAAAILVGIHVAAD